MVSMLEILIITNFVFTKWIFRDLKINIVLETQEIQRIYFYNLNN